MSKNYRPIRPRTNSLYRGDNLAVMCAMPDAIADLIYIDPPFFTQKDYKNIWGDRESVADFNSDFFNGFKDTKDFFEKHIQSDAKGLKAYLEWMRARLVECYRLLKPTGSFYLHLDHHAVHYVKVMLDEIFGYDNFRNEITWQRKIGSNSTSKARSWPNNSDFILFYTKSNDYYFEPQYVDDSDGLPTSVVNAYKHDDNDGKGPYQRGPLEAPSDSPTLKFTFKGVKPPKKGWRWKKERMQEAFEQGLLYITDDKSTIRQKMYLSNRKGAIVESIWTDIRCVQGGSTEYLGWPTQKPVTLLERIIAASSKENDLIFDCFAGCGSTMMAAHNLKRRWIGIDISPTAADVNKKRLEIAKAKVEVIEEGDLEIEVSKLKRGQEKKVA
jgi:site-specific DNA-methyltransferase (adenine-specific)